MENTRQLRRFALHPIDNVAAAAEKLWEDFVLPSFHPPGDTRFAVIAVAFIGFSNAQGLLKTIY